jgi:outer membrane protein TolC
MNGCHRARLGRTGLLVVWLCGGLAVGGWASAQDPELPPVKPEAKADERLPAPRPSAPSDAKADPTIEAALPQPGASILPSAEAVNAVDLGCVLRLAGVDNPDILIARQRVATATAERLLAFAQFLPNLNAGVNYNSHVGNLQQSDGNILSVNRSALYTGLGAGAIAAGTVNVPGILLAGNPGMALFDALAARQLVRVRQAESQAVRNQIFLQVANGYMELLRAEGHRAIAMRNQQEAHEIARLTLANARKGRGKYSDANRAASELARRNYEVMEAEQSMIVASAALARLLNLPPSIQLHGIDGWVVPTPLVPQGTPLSVLLLYAINQRPELAARRAAIRVATDYLRAAQVMPLSPTVWAGFSAGTFGGGSNLIAQSGGLNGFSGSRFGSFAPRDDVDAILYWTAQNMGVGNFAQIRLRGSERQIANLEFIRELNTVRNDVAKAYAGIHARYAQIDIARDQAVTAQRGYQEDFKRSMETDVGLPIELLNNFRLLAHGRYNYLDAVVDYDESQFALYVAIGQPPPSMLPKEMPGDLIPPPAPAPPLPACDPARGCVAAGSAGPKIP